MSGLSDALPLGDLSAEPVATSQISPDSLGAIVRQMFGAPSASAPNPYASQVDPFDMTNKYNTALTPDKEAEYQNWLAQMSAKSGRDMSNDSYDYDMRGAWNSGAAASDNGHYPDTFKKPNHPTFSDQSQYHGVDGYWGGQWGGGNGQPWSFTPGSSNLTHFTPEQLQGYFAKVEPGNVLSFQQPGWLQNVASALGKTGGMP